MPVTVLSSIPVLAHLNYTNRMLDEKIEVRARLIKGYLKQIFFSSSLNFLKLKSQIMPLFVYELEFSLAEYYQSYFPFER